MSDTGIKQLSKVIEFIKKKKISRAQVEYQSYSKMPSKKCSDYITSLQERVLKGEIDIGNIPDSELELFNEKPSEEDALKRKGEVKRNILIAGVIGLICFVIYLSGGFETNSTSSSSSSNKIDTCKCLTSSGYYNSNESSCDRVINAYIGGNWKGSMNHSQTAKWNQLKSRCGY
tara:strand:- start:35 stop:556 length:522 start_codon:yes stop_codon:yes gene_type:complete